MLHKKLNVNRAIWVDLWHTNTLLRLFLLLNRSRVLLNWLGLNRENSFSLEESVIYCFLNVFEERINSDSFLVSDKLLLCNDFDKELFERYFLLHQINFIEFLGNISLL